MELPAKTVAAAPTVRTPLAVQRPERVAEPVEEARAAEFVGMLALEAADIVQLRLKRTPRPTTAAVPCQNLLLAALLTIRFPVVLDAGLTATLAHHE